MIYLNENILDDLDTVRDDSAAKLASSPNQEKERPQLTHRVELIIRRWISNSDYYSYESDVAKAMVTIKRQIQSVMESFSFVKSYEMYFVYGDDDASEDTLRYDGDSITIEHAPDESHGSFIIDLYFAAPNFKYTYVDRFIKTMFQLGCNWGDFYVDNMKVKNMRGQLNQFSADVVIESDIYTTYLEQKRYEHFLMVMKQFVQEIVPLGDWHKYVERKNLVDEQNFCLLDNCSKGDAGTYLTRLGMSTFEVTDLLKRYRYINVWAMNIAKNGGLFLDGQGNFYKHKSDNPTAKKEEFLKALQKYIDNTAKSFRLYEGSGARTYQMYIVFEEPFIFMDVEYVLIFGGSDYQSDDVFKISRILMMLVLAGETPERTVDRYLSKRNDAYPKSLRHDLLELLNFNIRKKKGFI